MMLLVDTSVWSLAMRRDTVSPTPEMTALLDAVNGVGPGTVVTTGVILQELLQGFGGPKAREAIIERFSSLPLLQPDRQDHIAAAEVRNLCRRQGVQVGTIDALLIQLCGRHDLTLLTCDQDFSHAAEHVSFKLWRGA